MRRIVVLIFICLGLAALTARAAHTQVKLILSAETAKPGDTIWAGVDMKMEPGWHTYWKNPGEAGVGHGESNGSCRPAFPPAKSSGRCRKNCRPQRSRLSVMKTKSSCSCR